MNSSDQRPLWAIIVGALFGGIGLVKLAEIILMKGFVHEMSGLFIFEFIIAALFMYAGWAFFTVPPRERAGFSAVGLSVILNLALFGHQTWRVNQIRIHGAESLRKVDELMAYREHETAVGQWPGSPALHNEPIVPQGQVLQDWQNSGTYSNPAMYKTLTSPFEKLSPESAKSVLQQNGIPYNESSFSQRAAEGDMRAVVLFLKSGMSIDVRDSNGDTPLIKAVGAVDRASWGGNNEIVKALIQAGADVNAVGGQNQTALKLATFMRQDQMVQMLKAAGATQ